jgi:hypothetical protein
MIDDDDGALEVMQTISDEEWERIEHGAARVMRMVDGPWASPAVRAVARNWAAARRKGTLN